MNIQWRKHENILGFIILLEFVAANYIRDARLSNQLIKNVYEMPFIERAVPFQYFKHILFPDILMGIVMYVCQLYFNSIIVKRFIYQKRYGSSFIHLITLFLVLLIASTLSVLLLNEFDYRSPLGNNLSLLHAITKGSTVALTIFLSYLFYTIAREFIIFKVEKKKDPAYYALICNRISLVAIIYFSILGFTFFLKYPNNPNFFISFLFIVPIVILTAFTEIFWVFPSNSYHIFFKKNNLAKTVGNIVLVSIPFGILFILSIHGHGDLLKFLLVSWSIQLVLVTPMAWWIYQWQKKNIEALLGLEMELHQTNADLGFLRSQINPHFLFNTLNTVYGTALNENAPQTAHAIQQLGSMMRFLLDDSNQRKIALSKEIEYLHSYVDLQKMRIKDNQLLQINMVMKEPTVDSFIEPMLLIPFVENAFKHGLSGIQPCFIKIELRTNQQSIDLRVHNSRFEKSNTDPEKERNGVGLENVRKRLVLLYPNKHQLIIKESTGDYSVHLSIQLS